MENEFSINSFSYLTTQPCNYQWQQKAGGKAVHLEREAKIKKTAVDF